MYPDKTANLCLNKSIEKNKEEFKRIFEDCNDIIFREFKAQLNQKFISILLVSTDGLVSGAVINNNIIKPIKELNLAKFNNKMDIDLFSEIVQINSLKKTSDYKEIIHSILSGETLFIVDGLDEALLLNTKEWESRPVEESSVEKVVRGSKDSFVEDLRSNTAMIRRKLKDPSLKVKEMKIGSRSNTNIAILYLDDLVNKQVLRTTIEQLKKIEVDGIFDSGYIEEMLETNHYSVFPQMQVTERPDKVSGNLLEGRISILVDGSPDALIFPVGFAQFLQSPEDYTERILYGNIVRVIRLIGFLIATTFPAFYVAITTYHQEILPTAFILDIAKTRINIPYPPVIEALLMEGTIELLREASNRLPTSIGQTIGIVGAIVIGDAAVRAGLASPIMVIVVAITAIGSYIFPHFSTSYSVRLIRIPMIIMAATFGAFGIVIVWVILIGHMCKLHSVGNPYMAPFAPMESNDLKDAIFRFPLWKLNKRPISSSKSNRYRKKM